MVKSPRAAASTAHRLAKSDRQPAFSSGKQHTVGVARPPRRRVCLRAGQRVEPPCLCGVSCRRLLRYAGKPCADGIATAALGNSSSASPSVQVRCRNVQAANQFHGTSMRASPPATRRCRVKLIQPAAPCYVRRTHFESFDGRQSAALSATITPMASVTAIRLLRAWRAVGCFDYVRAEGDMTDGRDRNQMAGSAASRQEGLTMTRDKIDVHAHYIPE